MADSCEVAEDLQATEGGGARGTWYMGRDELLQDSRKMRGKDIEGFEAKDREIMNLGKDSLAVQ